MNRSRFVIAGIVFASCVVVIAAAAEKPPELAKIKFKDLVKLLNLTAEQQATIKPDVARIQEIVKQADKQRGTAGYGAGGRTPVGGGRWGGGITGSPSGAQITDRGERHAQRVEWQREITNRIDEIKSVLTPGQLEKFKTIQVPDLMAQPGIG